MASKICKGDYSTAQNVKLEFSIDRGGTFTDIYCNVLQNDTYKESIVYKLLSEDPIYGDGPREGIRRLIENILNVQVPVNTPIPSKHIKSLRMGTTVATNALLERKGVKTALIVTKGFKDLLKIGNQSRPNIFDLTNSKPEVLYEAVLEVDERVRILKESEDRSQLENICEGITGEYVEIQQRIDEQQVEKDLAKLKESGIEALSIVFMHSPSYSKHEEIVGQIAEKLGFPQISLSSKIIPMIKILPRGSTATLDAYLNPYIFRYLQSFVSGFDSDISQTQIYFMQSDGGLCDISNFRGSRSILSGPAGGVIGYAETSKFLLKNNKEFKGIIGFDMGGTSTDVSRYDGIKFDHIFDAQIAGVMIQTPHLDINTVAAGGGSRLFYTNGIFKVGPESAGATPGPVCYGRNGYLAITDANLILGRIQPKYFPKIFGKNNDEELFKNLTIQKFEELTNVINDEISRTSNGREVKKMTIQEVAYGYVKVANESMCRPIRNITQGKGCNPKHDILNIFGGAGAQHACSIASKLGMRKIFIHEYAGILSAYGLDKANVIEESSLPLQVILDLSNNQQKEDIKKKLDELQVKNAQILSKLNFAQENIHHERYLSVRYEGTDTQIQILETGCNQDVLAKFVSQHQKEFGFVLDKRRICIDQCRVRTIANKSQEQEEDSEEFSSFIEQTQIQKISEEMVYFEVEGVIKEVKTPVYQMETLEPSSRIQGPSVILNNTSTIIIEPGWTSLVTKKRNLLLSENKLQQESVNYFQQEVKCDPIELSIFSNRFMSIAEQMGRTLQRTAVSTNIKERLDFSCAIFAPDGSLVANAPHLPVHLGSMSEAIKYQIRTLGSSWKEDEVILSNHPAAGGSHLPDITIITPVFDVVDQVTQEKKPIFYIASRGHHADVGGLTPGSMPPFSRSILDEGIAIKSLKIVRDGILQEQEIIDIFTNPGPNQRGTRALNDNISDIKAQVSANNRGVELIKQLIQEYSLHYVQAYMHFIQDNAEESVRRMLVDLSIKNKMAEVDTVSEIEYMDDGTPICLKLTIDRTNRKAHLDFDGTGFQVLSNINAPYAVTTSAIIYCLRCLVNSEIPLNEGCLKPITFNIPKNSLLCPSENSPIVGGNVLTSQRITDLILKAFKACAASYGCMNNLTFGNDTMSYYETICGGAGAGPSWNGQNSVQCHMTNTRITDPEILERRYPVILRKFEIRQGSGGQGQYKGGDGVIREFQFLQPLKVSILSERRVFAPFGLNGGENGAKGLNLLVQGDLITNLGAKNTVDVQKNDIIIIHTPGGGGYGDKNKKQEQLDEKNNTNTYVNLGSESTFKRKQETC
ncbi:hydantoinase/oxoprolinase (macronuclear) [Tetrahymena thermophila SB210]|uniref:Hydantoinase/oxoprolinase n=1 Tax=Tetrahymena thermophila (strain SB210) TaxID=312017 RepID=Q22SC1_TETTS|nr:hydantoinase/oxoprolinase [Tetrahymena thermophila SB210]EAR87851.1 hydantoinase/oxoprolinase [Tetrahymena thermophila SB210]|eukprot:XP_001008096.1 hydantoinase/oxoprolinase [Tetrahymena thermophila SB210]